MRYACSDGKTTDRLARSHALEGRARGHINRKHRLEHVAFIEGDREGELHQRRTRVATSAKAP